MTRRERLSIVGLGLLLPLGAVATVAAAEGGTDDYPTLVELFEEWRVFQRPSWQNGVPDYSAAAMARQHRALAGWRARLAAIRPGDWPIPRQIDYTLVWAEMNGLDFDHRVLRPWARDPAFYALLIDSESDTPLKEGPVIDGAVELWRWTFPLTGEQRRELRDRLGAIPALLEQARRNLLGEARDLWRLGIRSQQQQQSILTDLGEPLARHHPELVAEADTAYRAVGAFIDWLREELPSKNGASGIGVEAYDWYLRNVHLLPLSWADELRLMERELARSVSQLAIEEHRNRDLAILEPPMTAAEWAVRNDSAIVAFLRFLDQQEVMTVEDYMEPALRERLQPWASPETRHFFAQVNMRDPRVLLCHFIHWIEKAQLEARPHASPIRRRAALYNIWDSRAEGLATGMEEMMMSAGMFADSPRSRELVYIMIAMRAARAIAALRVQSNDWSVDEAIEFATRNTPRGWFRADGDLVVFEQQLYLQQPGYGTSYLTGKALIDRLLAEIALTRGGDMPLSQFLSDLFETGMIPVSLVRWELTGSRDWLPPLSEPTATPDLPVSR